MYFSSLLLLVAASLSAGFGTDLDSLPPLPPEEAGLGRDWLVHPPDREAAVYRLPGDKEIALDNGLIRRSFRIAPNVATVALDNLTSHESLLRGVKPEAIIEIDGAAIEVGGLKGQPNYAFLRADWVEQLEADPTAMQFVGFTVGKSEARFAWKQDVRHHAPGTVWPPEGAYLRMDFVMPKNAKDELRGVQVSVHYELYDGVPAFSKWITVKNAGRKPVTLTGFTSEILAAVEYESSVESGPSAFNTPNLHVETDYAFNGNTGFDASRTAVHWVSDPDYETQVNYQRVNPCLLEVRPEIGPGVVLAPGEEFASFRTFVLPYDSYDRERNGLALRRMYRCIAPWATENPLMMHARFADWKAVKSAIDQCAEVGFEMVILTFGSGFNVENDAEEYLDKMKEYADYARSKGIEIGGYSLLASRHIDADNDVVLPEGSTPVFGHSPCIGSAWGQDYFRKLYQFYEESGFTLLEHDGSYPGDPCQSTEHPGHRGYDDSRWTQWRTITQFYQWCRERGIYLNVPDYYYLSGSTKSAMGYRETNWSLPRDQQVIHTRQNIYDGTWEKTPSMGWMFVPLTEYQGGGEAATIEPLDAHLDHYERILVSNLALGAQACYRGPRLFDTDRTKGMLKRWVDWYKAHRDILESDLIHGRRADGRDIDWMLHVNPRLDSKGMLVVFNPLDQPVERELEVGLYYTGLDTETTLRGEDGKEQVLPLARDYSVKAPVSVPANGFAWYTFE